MMKILNTSSNTRYILLLLTCLYVLVSQPSNVNAQTTTLCDQSVSTDHPEGCETTSDTNPLFIPLSIDTRIDSAEQERGVFKPIQDIDSANMSLTNITTPCTRNCAKTCEVCVLGACAPEPICYATCQATAAICWSLVDRYKLYMSGYIQRNITYYRLSPQVVNALAPYTERAISMKRSELDEITVGTSGTAGENNAMTDCDRITWVNSPTGNSIEHALRGTNKNSDDIIDNLGDVHWIYHEFVHTFQCNELGGRTEYAYHWFGDLGEGLINAIAIGHWPNGREIHDHQPSEQDADARGNKILDQMPIIVPRYVMGIQPLGTQLSGSTVNFVANARNVLSPRT